MTSILFAIPCYGGMVQDHTVTGLYNIGKNLEREGISHDLMLMANNSLISEGRSTIANIFMNDTQHDYLMCIDADIGFKWQDILKLISHKKAFVTGAYSMKTLPPQYNFMIHDSLETDGNLVRIDHIGTGFQLIHRCVFEELAKAYPRLKFTPSPQDGPVSDARLHNSYHYYQCILDEYMVSEDISFCKRFNNIGGKIWLDPEIELAHGGNHIYNGIPNFSDEIHNFIKERK